MKLTIFSKDAVQYSIVHNCQAGVQVPNPLSQQAPNSEVSEFTSKYTGYWLLWSFFKLNSHSVQINNRNIRKINNNVIINVVAIARSWISYHIFGAWWFSLVVFCFVCHFFKNIYRQNAFLCECEWLPDYFWHHHRWKKISTVFFQKIKFASEYYTFCSDSRGKLQTQLANLWKYLQAKRHF